MSKQLVTNELWEAIEPLLPPERPKPNGGRPRVPDRAALTAAIRTAEEAARRLGATSYALEGVEFGTLAEQRHEMSEEWNSALGTFIQRRRVRTPQGGYHYPFDAETPTWLVKIRGTFQAPSGPGNSAVVHGVMLVLADARTGEMIGTEDLQASPED